MAKKGRKKIDRRKAKLEQYEYVLDIKNADLSFLYYFFNNYKKEDIHNLPSDGLSIFDNYEKRKEIFLNLETDMSESIDNEHIKEDEDNTKKKRGRKPKDITKSHSVTVRLYPEQSKSLSDMILKTGFSVTAIIHNALQYYKTNVIDVKFSELSSYANDKINKKSEESLVKEEIVEPVND